MAYFSATYRVPGDTELYRWADWAELLCLTAASGSLTLDEFAQHIEDRRDYLAVEGKDDRDPSKPDTKDELLEAAANPAVFKDRTVERAVNTAYLLESRSRAYGTAYPFVVEVGGNKISLAEGETVGQNIYLFLLACSSLRYVDSRTERSRLAAAFETLSRLTLETRLPHWSNIHHFGTSSANAGRYTGALVDRIALLADDLGEALTPQFDAARFERGDFGDHGLDLVAWLPWGDDLRGRPIFFAQCACTSAWISKQSSSSYARWVQVMTFAVPPTNACYIPFDFRSADDNWYNELDINSTLLVDRRRFLGQLGLLDGQTPSTSITATVLADLGTRAILDAKRQDLADI